MTEQGTFSLMFDEGNILVEMSCDRIRFVNISISEHLNYFSVQQNIFQNSGCLVGLDIRLLSNRYYLIRFEKNQIFSLNKSSHK